jgi:cytochrome c-type biogenesis protein CcmF
VPWLTLVAAGHLMMIVKHKKSSPTTALFLTILSYLLILYSTFLTRSGILGDTSVHAFVDLGLNSQLIIFLGYFSLGSLFIFLWHWKRYPKSPLEDAFNSREFWMFIGSLTLLLSAAQIIFSTSIPVFNKIIGPEGLIPILENLMAPPADAAKHFNSLQIPFALVITLLMAFVPFLRWKETPNALIKRVLPSALISVAVSAFCIWGLELYEPLYAALLVVSIFGVLSNADYWLRILRGRWTGGGMAMAHLGFTLVLLGALISNGKKEAISTNASFIHEDFPANENILLPMSDTVSMYPYYVSWQDERIEGHNRVFDIDFFEADEFSSWEDFEKPVLKKSFTLNPFIQINDRMGNVREPSTKHFWNRDIYTYISYADLRPLDEKNGEWSDPSEAVLSTGEEVFLFQKYLLYCDTLFVENASVNNKSGEIDFLDLNLKLILKSMNGEKTLISLPYHLDGDRVKKSEITLDEKEIKFRFDGVATAEGKFNITAWEKKNEDPPFVLMQAFIFPYINLLWLGAILMGIGTLLAVWKRVYQVLNQTRK